RLQARPPSCPQAARRPRPPRAGHAAPRRTRPPARGPGSCATPRQMPTREHSRARGPRGNPQTRPPGPGPPVSVAGKGPQARPWQRSAGRHRARGGRSSTEPSTGSKYPPVSSQKERSRYVAVFQDQYGEFLELRQELGSTQAKLQQLETLLSSLPPPQSQEEAQVAARVRREFEKKCMDPGFLDKQLRCHYLKGKLRHLKTQIQKFDDQEESEGSVYF
uniref:Occludin/ELL domain containing 1 n=1 Tax=Sciurus vulgaris TaxID=55149 RepID=A0A8D2DX76_SCIVU